MANARAKWDNWKDLVMEDEVGNIEEIEFTLSSKILIADPDEAD